MPTNLLENRVNIAVGTDAFRQEYSPKVNSNALRKDIESYLGEYRFDVQEYQYELLFGTSTKGEIHLIDVDDREPMVDKATRALERRVDEGKNINREEAELQGLLNLERQLQRANLGDKIIWMSPPGPTSDCCGDYGYIFTGVVDLTDPYNQEKHLSMTAIRVESPTLAQFNSALIILTGQVIEFEKAEEFLASPFVIPGFWENSEHVVSYIFNLKPNGKNDSLYSKIIPLLSPYINEFIDYVKQGAPKEFLFWAFQTVELLALDLIEEYSRVNSLQPFFVDRDVPLTYAMTNYQGQVPPRVAGSCGSTGNSSGGLTSSNIFNNYSSLAELFSTSKDGKEPFVCPKCGFETTGSVGNQCPSCKLTKDQAVIQGYVTC